MPRYEYKIVETKSHKIKDVLNDYGALGWRLKETYNDLTNWKAIFERELTECGKEAEDSSASEGKTIEGLLIETLLEKGPTSKKDLLALVERVGAEMDLYHGTLPVPRPAHTIVAENLIARWINEGLIGPQETDESVLPRKSVIKTGRAREDT
jgi:hypothetical protein